MTFEQRKAAKPDPASVPHECPLPRWRWLPFLVWPRWSEGATWVCEWCDEGGPILGCGQRWVWSTECGMFGCFVSWSRVKP